MNNDLNEEVVDINEFNSIDFNLEDIINSLDDNSNIEKSNETEKLNESKIDTLKCLLDIFSKPIENY